MPSVQLRPEADADLLSLSSYIAADNPLAAKDWVDRIDEVFVRLSEYPELGQRRPEFGEDVRTFPVMNVVVVYRPIDDGVEVVRVLHESRDFPSEF